MNRRHFLATAAAAAPFLSRAAFLSDARGADAANATPEWRRFEITTRVTLPDDAGASQLWLPLAQTAGDYQTSLDLRWQGSGKIERLHDARYGASVLRTAWDGGQREPRQLEVVQTVATRDRRSAPLLPLTEAERKFWTAPTASTTFDNNVLATAARITAARPDQRAQARAIYDWIVDHTYRDPDTPGCGKGDIRTMLASGKLGGKCADINTLLVGLARAAGLPAREVYGLRVADSRLYPSLGRSGNVSKAQHCRAEVFLDDEGWFPLDPADVRKLVLEGKVALDSPEGRALRERMFGQWEMNWVGYNSATDIELPGAKAKKPDFAFLMYPCAVTEKGNLPCLDPAKFQYEITSRELTA